VVLASNLGVRSHCAAGAVAIVGTAVQRSAPMSGSRQPSAMIFLSLSCDKQRVVAVGGLVRTPQRQAAVHHGVFASGRKHWWGHRMITILGAGRGILLTWGELLCVLYYPLL
jgi:hypothetical protein